MSRKRRITNKKDRKQRWAAIIAVILAVAMALSAIAAYANGLFSRHNDDTVNPAQEFDPETYRVHCQDEVKRLKKYISQYGSAAGVLGELCKNYRLLIQIEKAGDKVDEKIMRGYETDLKKFSRELVELEPDKPEHRLQLLYLYEELGEDSTIIGQEIDALRKMLHQKADSYYLLALIEFMQTSGQPRKSIDKEIAWLKGHFEKLSARTDLSNHDRYPYALLLGEYLEELPTALEQLGLILKTESPETELYSAAENYRKILQQRKKNNL